MSKKPDLSTQMGERKRPEQPMTVEPVVPQNALVEAEQALLPEAPGKARLAPASLPETPRPARPRKAAQIRAGGVSIDEIKKAIQVKKHLASYTLRFRSEELEELERVYHDIESHAPGALSRNDIARAALLYLLTDYRENGDKSALAQIAGQG